MANFQYIAVGPDGAETRGALEVSSQMEAVRRVREMGLFPTRIKQACRPAASSASGRPLYFNRIAAWRHRRCRVKPARLVVFTRQLATMLGAGMSLLRSLRILEQQETGGTFHRVIAGIVTTIENGGAFSEALANYPTVFNGLYVNLVKAGEASGALEGTLRQLAGFLEQSQKLRAKLKAAMVYPCAVLLVAAGVVGLLMALIVPSFQRLFDGMLEGAPLPAFTRLVFGLSNVIVHRSPLILMIVVVIAAVGAGLAATRVGSVLLDKAKLTLPLLGPLFSKAAIARFARTLGTLAGNGVPILQALTIVEHTTGNRVISGVVARVHEQVKQGDTIAPVLRSSGVFPPMVAGMVDVGEQTGALPDMLMKIADTYDDEFDNTAKSLMSLLEPVLIIALAVVVGAVVIAMFLPIISLATHVDAGPGDH
jgi:type IV pilus assembly protein PilC